MFIRLVPFFTLISSLVISQGAKLPDCPTLLTNADTCVKSALMIGDRNNVLIPKTLQQINNQCKSMKDHFYCINNYRKCLTSTPRQVFTLITSNLRKIMKSSCDSESAQIGKKN